jgi:carbamoyl-phosphate synthase large subunit
MNILILSAGRRVSLFLSFQKELKKYFPESDVYTIDANPERSSVCQINKRNSAQISMVHDADYVKNLTNFVQRNNIKIIIPTIDTELKVLSDLKEEFATFGCEIVISDKEFIENCQDKENQKDFFELFDIKTPQIYKRNKITYPAFAKPKNGSRSQGIVYLNSPEDMSERIKNDQNLMFMELVSADDYQEFTVDMYFTKDSSLLSLVPRERLAVRDGEISIGRTVKGKLYKNLLEKFSYLKGARGCITAQFFYSAKANQLLGIEINPRFGGGYPLSRAAGVNFQENIIQEYALQNKNLIFNDCWKENVVMLRHDSEVFINE